MAKTARQRSHYYTTIVGFGFAILFDLPVFVSLSALSGLSILIGLSVLFGLSILLSLSILFDIPFLCGVCSSPAWAATRWLVSLADSRR